MIAVTVATLASFARYRGDVKFLLDHLTWPKSDFSKMLAPWADGDDLPYSSRHDALIALVRDNGAIVGWARTEPWQDLHKHQWPTLEAFVSLSHRRRGIAALASMALASESIHSNHVAVFHPAMLLVASRAGMKPTLFQKDEQGVWRLAR